MTGFVKFDPWAFLEREKAESQTGTSAGGAGNKPETLASLATLAGVYQQNQGDGVNTNDFNMLQETVTISMAYGHAEKPMPTRAKVAKVAKVGTELPFSATLVSLERKCPAYVDEARWQQCVNDARRFLPEWGTQAEALGWTARELFGLHAPPAKPHPSYDRLSRYDETGMLWGLDGRRVIALSSNTAAVETGTGNTLTYRKLHKPALGPFGDSLEDFK